MMFKKKMKNAKYYLLMALLLLLATSKEVCAESIETILDQENGAVFALYYPANGSISLMNLDRFESDGYTELRLNSTDENLSTSNVPTLNQQTTWSLETYSLTWIWASGFATGSHAQIVNLPEIVEPNTPGSDLSLVITETYPPLYWGGFSTMRGYDFRGGRLVQNSQFGNIYVIPEPTAFTLAMAMLIVFQFRGRS